MAKATGTYLGTDWVVSLILSFFFGVILAIVHRFQHKRTLMGILALVFFWTGIFWVVDFISLLATKKISWLM